MPPMKKVDSNVSSNTNKHEDSSSQPRLSDSEDWTKLTDISSRRRVQNRLAQRHRREKLRQEKEPESKTPDQEQQRPEQHEFTPCRTLHKTSSNLSDGQLNFPDLSMSAKDTKMLLCQLDHAQSQLLEYVSEKPSDYELPMPRTSQDMTVSQQTYWDPSLLSAFDGNNLGTISNNLDQGTSLPNMTAMDTARYTNGLNPNVRDDAISITRTPTNLVSVPQTSKPEYQYMTPPKSFPNPKQTTLSDSRHSIFDSSQKGPIDPSPTINSRTTLCTSHGSDINGLDNTRGNTALHLAAQQGHLETVRLLLKIGGVDINASNEDGMSALHVAITQGNTAITELLLEHGASSSLRNNNYQNTLHLAVENGGVALVQLLLNYVTNDLDSRDLNGKSAFHLAVAKGDEEIVRSMLLKGVNSRAKVGEQTPGVEKAGFDWSTTSARELQ